MRHLVDQRFLAEAERFRLRATCECCIHYCESTTRCAQGYPNAEHRARELQVGDDVVFCKEFELW